MQGRLYENKNNEKLIACIAYYYNRLPCELKKYKYSELAEALVAIEYGTEKQKEAQNKT